MKKDLVHEKYLFMGWTEWVVKKIVNVEMSAICFA